MQEGDTLLSSVKQYITPDFIKMGSGLIGETPEKFQAGFLSAIPPFLSGLINKGTTQEGAQQLMKLIQEENYEAGVPSNFLDTLKGGKTSERFLKGGADALNAIFGEKAGTLVNNFAKGMNLNASAATKIFSLAAPLVMGTLGTKVKELGLNASSLVQFLSQQKSSLSGLMPSMGIHKMGIHKMGIENVEIIKDPMKQVSPIRGKENIEPLKEYSKPIEEKRKRSLLPLGLAALLLLGGYLATRGWQQPEINQAIVVQEQAGTLEDAPLLPPDRGLTKEGEQSQVLTTEQFSAFLETGSSQELPKRFDFNTLRFFSGSTKLMPGFEQTMDDIALALKNNPTVVVGLESFTDNVGNSDANLRLSFARAETVKQALVDRGIDSDRIQPSGRGASHPIASNETSEGRSFNRRTEIVVLQK